MDQRIIRLPATAESYPQAQHFVEACLEELDCPMKVQIAFNIACDEVLNNIISYSGSPWAELSLQAEAGVITMVFADAGVAYNPLEHEDPDITLSAQEREPGGLGILIVKKSMDQVTYERLADVNRLTLRKRYA